METATTVPSTVSSVRPAELPQRVVSEIVCQARSVARALLTTTPQRASSALLCQTAQWILPSLALITPACIERPVGLSTIRRARVLPSRSRWRARLTSTVPPTAVWGAIDMLTATYPPRPLSSGWSTAPRSSLRKPTEAPRRSFSARNWPRAFLATGSVTLVRTTCWPAVLLAWAEGWRGGRGRRRRRSGRLFR